VRKYVAEVSAQPQSPASVATATGELRTSAPSISRAATAREDQEAIAKAADASGVALLTREQMIERLESANIKTLPGAVAELLALVGSPRGTVADVAQSLKRDPVLSSRVLRAANSAAFASKRVRIANVEDAVKHIGLGGVRNLVTSVGVIDTYASGPEAQNLLPTWQHSLAVASLMERFTPETDASPAGVAYVVGLCHELGDIVLREHFPQEQARVVELVRRTGRPQRQVQAEVYGVSHSEFISLLLTRVGLPGVVTAPIQEFFERALYRQSGGAGSILGRALRIANVYAHGLMLAPSMDEPLLPLSVAECRAVLGDTMPEIDDAQFRADALTNACYLAGLSGPQISQACEPPIPRQTVRVCYVRPAEYAAVDPFLALLKLIASDVELLVRLPNSAADLRNFNLLFMAGSSAADIAHTERVLIDSLARSAAIPFFYFSRSPTEQKGHLPPNVCEVRLPPTIRQVGEFVCSGAKGARHAA
jgi:HD-like signal output (HDOD) protein